MEQRMEQSMEQRMEQRMEMYEIVKTCSYARLSLEAERDNQKKRPDRRIVEELFYSRVEAWDMA